MFRKHRQEVSANAPAGAGNSRCAAHGPCAAAGRPTSPVPATALRFPCRLLLIVSTILAGCRSEQVWQETAGNDTTAVDRITHQVDHPSVHIHSAALTTAPVTVRYRQELDSISYRDLTLDEVLRIALKNSEVLRELGGTILTNPDRIQSRYASALRHSDPRFSQEAALSAFDTQLRASSYFSNNDQRYNNPFSAGGATAFKQDLHEYNLELSRLTATGSRLSLRSTSIHDANNAPGNTFR
ncbi:MAG: hypothetical protein NXI04_29410, partial [Planctomycetaceae bacterium]|nr:hypothetical protein [Planctomycetaceae bacterium]